MSEKKLIYYEKSIVPAGRLKEVLAVDGSAAGVGFLVVGLVLVSVGVP